MVVVEPCAEISSLAKSKRRDHNTITMSREEVDLVITTKIIEKHTCQEFGRAKDVKEELLEVELQCAQGMISI